MSRVLVDGIVGTRPNMMKMASLARIIERDGTFRLRLIHTGQHYDEQMSEVFFHELGLPAPAFNLNVGSGTHGVQTARILEGYERILLADERPRGVIVVGDVTSTLACTLAASKLNLPVAHVEAGLRSGDRTMPEEINRIVTDDLSDIHFVSDPDGLANLAREGHPPDKIYFVGNTMIDTMLAELPDAIEAQALQDLGLNRGGYVYVTLHRPCNVDHPQILRRIIRALEDISHEAPVIFAVHPRTRCRLDEANLTLRNSQDIRVIGPQGYRQNLSLLHGAMAVLTDSGGIQEETSVLNVPCLTLREATERPVTIEFGSSELVGTDPERIRIAWRRVVDGHWKKATPIPLWDGAASERIVSRLRENWAPVAASDSLYAAEGLRSLVHV